MSNVKHNHFGWIEDLVRNFTLLIDTSALMSEGAEIFFYKILAPYLLIHKKKVIIPFVVLKELEHQKNKQQAIRAIKIYNSLFEQDLCIVKGEDSDTHPDQVFRRIYAQYQPSKNLAFITLDKKLAKELCEMANSKSVMTKYSINIISIHNDGTPFKICENGVFKDYKPKQKRTKKKKVELVSIENLNLDTSPLPISSIPSQGDTVFTQEGESIKLLEIISSGGEGYIYKTEKDNFVVKIYYKDKLTKDLQKKIEYMSQIHVKSKKNFKIAWPDLPIYNGNGDFVGFIMKKVVGKTLQSTIFIPKLLESKSYTRSDLVEIALNTLEAFRYLHLKDIIIGDINPYNILVDEKNIVSIIDTDSFQLGPFYCKVGTPQFTHPNNLGVNYANYKRKPKDEAFAVAVLIFMILHAGRHPFSHAGGDDVIENMRKREFPYRVSGKDDSSYENVPVGPWASMWSHLVKEIKVLLYEVLKEGKEPSTMSELIEYEKKLINILRYYKKLLLEGKRTNELFPKYYYIPDDIPKIKTNCYSCGSYIEITEEWNKKTKYAKCLVCLNKERIRRKMSNNINNVYSTNNKNTNNRVYSYVKANNGQKSKKNYEENILTKLFKYIFGGLSK